MKVFLSVKFPGDDSNRQDVEGIIESVEKLGAEVFCFRRDAEEWGNRQFTHEEMMRMTFDEIERSDFLIADVGDWPIGVGVEAGYAYAKGIPVICICRTEKKLPNTVVGLAKNTIRYKDTNDLNNQLVKILTNN